METTRNGQEPRSARRLPLLLLRRCILHPAREAVAT